MTDASGAVVIEADGGSRGNPGKAAYGAVLKEAATGRVLAERAERIGVASNNVAEYRGLIAGLELYREHADGAELEVRMDSKLVVEQMAGRWKIKHPSMRPLALQANRLAPPGTRWTWIPREQNKHADRLANIALDGPEGVVHGATPGPGAEPVAEPHADSRPLAPTTVVLVRDGSPEELEDTARWLGLAPGAVPAPDTDSDSGSPRGAARLRDRLRREHEGGVVVLVAAREVVAAHLHLALGLSPRTSPPLVLPPASVTVVRWEAEAAVVGPVGALPRLVLPLSSGGVEAAHSSRTTTSS